MPKKTTKKSSDNIKSHLGFENRLWLAADKLRNNMDAAEYKHVVLGLIFLKYISDSFAVEDKMRRLAGELSSQFEESARLQTAIESNLSALGSDIDVRKAQ